MSSHRDKDRQKTRNDATYKLIWRSTGRVAGTPGRVPSWDPSDIRELARRNVFRARDYAESYLERKELSVEDEPPIMVASALSHMAWSSSIDGAVRVTLDAMTRDHPGVFTERDLRLTEELMRAAVTARGASPTNSLDTSAAPDEKLSLQQKIVIDAQFGWLGEGAGVCDALGVSYLHAMAAQRSDSPKPADLWVPGGGVNHEDLIAAMVAARKRMETYVFQLPEVQEDLFGPRVMNSIVLQAATDRMREEIEHGVPPAKAFDRAFAAGVIAHSYGVVPTPIEVRELEASRFERLKRRPPHEGELDDPNHMSFLAAVPGPPAPPAPDQPTRSWARDLFDSPESPGTMPSLDDLDTGSEAPDDPELPPPPGTGL